MTSPELIISQLFLILAIILLLSSLNQTRYIVNLDNDDFRQVLNKKKIHDLCIKRYRILARGNRSRIEEHEKEIPIESEDLKDSAPFGSRDEVRLYGKHSGKSVLVYRGEYSRNRIKDLADKIKKL